MASDVTYIDRRNAHRDRPMEVLALGCGRTGTDSMRVALKTLGFDDCYHGYSCVHENPPDNYMWNEAMDAKFEGKGKPFEKKDWDQLLGNCMAVSDLPCVAFAPELIAAYPKAKVVLTMPPKDFDRWYRSCCDTIVTLKDDWRRDAWAFFHHEAWLTRKTFFRSFDYFWRGDFKKNAAEVFKSHNKEIRQLVPPEQLLEYDVSQGWEPLCEFLNKPIPEQAFPSGNDPQDFFRRFAAADWRRRKEVMMSGALLVAGAGALAFMLSTRSGQAMVPLARGLLGQSKSW